MYICTLILPAGQIPIEDITRIAGILENWEIVALTLGFKEVDITEIQKNHNAKKDRNSEFLRKWIIKDGTKATYERLYTTLIDLREQGQAESTVEIPQPLRLHRPGLS